MPSLITPGLMLDLMVAGESLRLRYDSTHYVSFSVTSTGALVITPTVGQAVEVTGFSASGAAALSGQTRIGDLFRVEQVATPDITDLTGDGIELHSDPTSGNRLRTYNYTDNVLTPLIVDTLSTEFLQKASFDEDVIVSNDPLKGVQWGAAGARIRWDGASILEVTNDGATGYVGFGCGPATIHGLLTLIGYGTGTGLVDTGAADSGGSGFRVLRVPN